MHIMVSVTRFQLFFVESTHNYGLKRHKITTALPDIPPDCVQADIVRPDGVTEKIFTYGSRLLNDEKYGHYDRDIRNTIAWCMAHRPRDRPTMIELSAIFNDALKRTAGEFTSPLESFRTSIPQLLDSPPPQRPSAGPGEPTVLDNPGVPDINL